MLRKGGKKEVCPSCGKKRFVPYVLTADGVTPAGPEFGRCDREQSCGYQRYPSTSSWIESKPIPPKPKLLLKPYSFSAELFAPVNESFIGNTLYEAYRELIGDDVLTEAFRRYRVQTGANGECIFPQYDGKVVRTAKAIMYGKDGHRKKGDEGGSLQVAWLHKSSNIAGELKQCFFGQHLLSEYPEKYVRVVESEKTAVLMSAVDNEHIYIACGGSQMLKGAIDLSVIENRKVMLIPDEGQFWNWYRIALQHASWEVCRNLDWEDGEDIWDRKERRMRDEIC